MQNFKRLIPCLNRILVRKLEPKNVTKSGIVLQKVEDNNPLGVVVEVGPGAYDPDGKTLPIQVKVGDTVILPDFGGSKVKLGDAEFFVYRDSEVLGVMKN